MSVDVIEPHSSQLNSYAGGTAGVAVILGAEALGCDDLRPCPIDAQGPFVAALARRPDGILISPLEQGEIGPD